MKNPCIMLKFIPLLTMPIMLISLDSSTIKSVNASSNVTVLDEQATPCFEYETIRVNNVVCSPTGPPDCSDAMIDTERCQIVVFIGSPEIIIRP